MQFIADLERNDDGGLQIMYGIDGRRDLTETLRRGPVRLRRRQPGPDRQRRVRPAPERRVRRRARLGAAAHPPQPAAAAAAVAADPGAGRVRDGGLAQPGSGHLGGARQAAALRLLEADVLGGDGPRRQARGRSAARASWPPSGAQIAAEIKADILEHGVDKRGVLVQHYDTESLDASTLLAAIFGFLPGDRRADARERARDRRRADRARVRAALPDRRDRRRAVGQGGDVRDLLVLARLGAGDHRRDAARSRPDDAAGQGRLAAGCCTPRSSTSTPAGIWGTSRRRSRTSRWSRPRAGSSSPNVYEELGA